MVKKTSIQYNCIVIITLCVNGTKEQLHFNRYTTSTNKLNIKSLCIPLIGQIIISLFLISTTNIVFDIVQQLF